ncbi:MAG: sugar transferase [Candidatus Omnitrophota bacterium]|nr:sugar transferase [Candidatus Omnitrophota bacterium]
MSSQKYASLAKKLRFKYLSDKFFAFFCLILAAPLFLMVTLLILWDGLIHPENKGSLFYTETRFSEGKRFQIIKFRTVPESVVDWIRKEPENRSITGREKVTWAGKWILKWYLDELPQLVNVLKGEMSIVGPRPHIEVHHHQDIAGGFHYRNYMKAGILGVPQACKRHPKYQAMFERMARTHRSDIAALNKLDGLYARKCLEKSAIGIFFFDVSLVIRGLIVVLRGS